MSEPVLFPELRPNRVQRVLVFALGAMWLTASALDARRDYQDAWMLDGIVLAWVVFALTSAVAMLLEPSDSVVALLASAFGIVAAAVPGLKYLRPYGVSLDSVQHYLLVESLIETGHVLPAHTYAAISGQHSWLAQLALLGRLSTDAVVAFGPAISAGLLPLIAYWLCRESGMAKPLTKRVLLLTCVAGPPAYMLNGTVFSLAPLLMTLGAAILLSFYSPTRSRKRAYLVVALIGIVQLVLWHSSTPLLLPILLMAVALAPLLLPQAHRHWSSFRPAWSAAGLAVVSFALFVCYHWLASDRIWQVIAQRVVQMLQMEASDAPLVPQSFFSIPLVAKLNVAAVLHGRDILLTALATGGALLAFRQMKREEPQSALLAALGLIAIVFAAMVFAPIPGASYQRFVWAPVALAPFFAAPAVLWLETKARQLTAPYSRAAHPLVGGVAAALILAWTIQIYPCQPLVPQVLVVGAERAEYVLWIHEVNTAQQARMLAFVESTAPEQERFAADTWSARQFLRLHGAEEAARRGMTRPLARSAPLEWLREGYFLIHWPGPAGGLGEQWPSRSREKVAELRSMPGWSVVYDNGESFVINPGPWPDAPETTRSASVGSVTP